MRELKGEWKDLFNNGFMIALDLRKMFLGFGGIVFTVVVCGGLTGLVGNAIDPGSVTKPTSIYPHEIWGGICKAWHAIYGGSPTYYIPYSIVFVLAFVAIWSYFGGAIARIAAYEIAKDGERVETTKALKFAHKKFWSFFWAPLICVIGFLFFFLCNAIGGALGRLLDIGWIGSPLVALLLPLALLSGFIMTLIVIGTFAGASLFQPAVAAEGTDAFDAVSRGFSYVYSRPWHYLWYQLVSAAYGYVCGAFVILFAVAMCAVALQGGAAGFDGLGLFGGEGFAVISDTAWSNLLSPEYQSVQSYRWNPQGLVENPDPYGRITTLANQIVQTVQPKPKESTGYAGLQAQHKVAVWIVFSWLLGTLGLAVGYAVSFFISQQTLIYYILRKKIDGIEMNEVYEELEEGERPPEMATAPGNPAPITAAPAPATVPTAPQQKAEEKK